MRILHFSQILIFTILCSCSAIPVNSNKLVDSKRDYYHEGQLAYQQKDYQKSLEAFQKFLDQNSNPSQNRKIIWAIDTVGKIYLKHLRTPAKAVRFFGVILNKFKLNDADEDNIQEWLRVSKDWMKFGKLPHKIHSPKKLFMLGQKYYASGMAKKKFPADTAGNADLYIASTYLVPYIYNYDGAAQTGQALFMLGSIRYQSWNDYKYWAENFYLKEVIRRFPNTPLAWNSYLLLRDSIHEVYTGSGGDFTPPSQLKILRDFEILAKAKSKKQQSKKAK